MKKLFLGLFLFITVVMHASDYATFCKNKNREDKLEELDHALKAESASIRSMNIFFQDSNVCCEKSAQCCDNCMISCVLTCCDKEEDESSCNYTVTCCGCFIGICNPCVWGLKIQKYCERDEKNNCGTNQPVNTSIME